MKVAIVCDWLVSVGGAERVLRSICDLFPGAPIYTSQYNEKKIDWFKDREVHVGYLQTFPTCFRRVLGPLRQKYFTKLDLSGYDLIISVTGAEAKSIKKGNALHLCYCHVPTQYYWGLKDDYLKNPGFGILNPLARLGLKTLLPPLKKADYAAANFRTNSSPSLLTPPNRSNLPTGGNQPLFSHPSPWKSFPQESFPQAGKQSNPQKVNRTNRTARVTASLPLRAKSTGNVSTSPSKLAWT